MCEEGKKFVHTKKQLFSFIQKAPGMGCGDVARQMGCKDGFQIFATHS